MDTQTLSMLPPKLLAQYLRDPQAMIAQEIMQKGGDTSPIKGGIWEGISRLGQGALGGYMSGRLREDYNTKAQGVADERAKAMAAAMGGKYMDAAGMLSAPDNQDLAGTMFGAKINQDQMGAQQAFMKSQQDRLFEQQKAMEQFKNDQNPINAILRQAMAAQGGALPQAPMMTPMPQGGIPQLNTSQLQGSPQGPIPMPPNPTQIQQGLTQQPPVNPNAGLGLFNAALGAKGLKAPEGMMFDQKMNLVPNVDGKMNDEQNKALGFAKRMKVSDNIISNPNITAAATSYKERAKDLPFIGNSIVSEDYQKYKQASSDFINATLRRESGAVISPQEFENADKQYFPQAGDGPEVLTQKAANRKLAMENIMMSGGPKGQAEMNAQPQGGSGMVKVTSPEGKTGIIDASELQQALANGWRQAQ